MSPQLVRPYVLKGKRILYIGHKLFLTKLEDVETSWWSYLKACGAEAIYVVLESSKENALWANRLFESGLIDDFNVEGLVQEDGDERSKKETVDVLIGWLNAKKIQVDVCLSAIDYLVLIQASLSEKLNLPSDSVQSVETVFKKDEAQKVVLNSFNASQHGVTSYAIGTPGELNHVLEKLEFPVIMKPLCGKASIGCRLLYDDVECRRHLVDLKSDMLLPGGKSTEKLSYQNKVVVMEYLKGSKYSVDVVICQGKLVGGVVLQKGPPELPTFFPTIASMPGDLSYTNQKILIKASYDCCLAVGLKNGVYDVDLAWANGSVPKLIEINPRPGGQGINDMATAVYNLDLFFINGLLKCGIFISPEDVSFVPKGHAVAKLFDYRQHRDILISSFPKMITSQSCHRGITLISPGMKTTEEYLEDNDVTYIAPILVVCAYHSESSGKAIEQLNMLLKEASVCSGNENPNAPMLQF